MWKDPILKHWKCWVKKCKNCRIYRSHYLCWMESIPDSISHKKEQTQTFLYSIYIVILLVWGLVRLLLWCNQLFLKGIINVSKHRYNVYVYETQVVQISCSKWRLKNIKNCTYLITQDLERSNWLVNRHGLTQMCFSERSKSHLLTYSFYHLKEDSHINITPA